MTGGDELTTAVRAWLADPVTLPTTAGIERVGSRVRRTRQRRRWLSVVPGGPRLVRAAAILVGAALLIAVPAVRIITTVEQEGGFGMRHIRFGSSVIASLVMAGAAAGVSAQGESAAPTAPVAFTGRIAFGDCVGSARVETSGGRTRELSADNDRYCEPTIIEPFSDPRLQGRPFVWQNNDEYAAGPKIYATAFSIVTDEGAWRGVPDIFLAEVASGDQVLVGEGAYEGLVAIATVDLVGDVWNWQGWIIDGDLPPLPDEPEPIP